MENLFKNKLVRLKLGYICTSHSLNDNNESFKNLIMTKYPSIADFDNFGREKLF